MEIKKLLTKNKLLVRIIISYLVSSILLTSILLVVISNLVSSRMKTQTTNASQDLLRQSYNTAEYVLTDIYGDFYTLWTKNESIKKVLYSSQLTNKDIDEAYNVIDREIFKNETLDSIYLFNKNENLVISNQIISTFEDFYDSNALELIDDFELNYESYKNEIFLPRKTGFRLNEVEHNKNYISIVYSTKDASGKLTSGIIVNIDQNSLSSLFNTSRNTGNMIIVNSSGKIISDLIGGNFGEYLLRNELYNKIAYSENNEDSFVADYNGEKSFVTFKKAENIGFVFISLIPYELLQSTVRNTNSYIGFFFVGAMLISLIFNLYSTKKIYGPLNKLINIIKENPSVGDNHSMDEYTFLGNAYDSLMFKDKQSHVSKVFAGNYNNESIDVLGYKMEDKFITFAVIPDDMYFESDLLDEIVNINYSTTKWTCSITLKLMQELVK